MKRIALLIVVLAALAATAGPAHAATTCSVPKYPGSGYFTKLQVTHVSCATGRKFVVSYYKCRTKHGVSGRCSSKVSGYSCKETRNTIETEIDAKVTCTNGSKRIVHYYQQNT
jgi:hypothetical protein